MSTFFDRLSGANNVRGEIYTNHIWLRNNYNNLPIKE